MSLLLKNAWIFDVESPNHNKKADLFIENGTIKSFEPTKADNEIDLKGKLVTVGWVDMNAHFNDPGLEHKEDLESGAETATKGGFTDVCISPNTAPPIQSKSDVEYVRKKSTELLDIHVCASLSEDMRGENLTEIMDLQEAGAVSFSDGDRPIWNGELLLKALQYTAPINGRIIQNARDLHISSNTHMHEGIKSTELGLRGEPSLSEELIVQRDLEILKYVGGHLHFSKISTARSVDLIGRAKKDGLKVTCDVGIHHLLFTDQAVGDFDTVFKSLPPYRSEADRQALTKGVQDGCIDGICSSHRPQDQESKQLEFDLSEPGAIGLQTFYPALLALKDEIEWERLIHCITIGPRKVLGLEDVKIDIGEKAKLTILDSESSWTLDASTNLSKSTNSPYWGKQLTGQVVGTINGETYSVSDKI